MRSILQKISEALAAEEITSQDAAELRQKIGVFGSDFTKAKNGKAKRKKARRAQQEARRVNQNRRKKYGKKITRGQKKSGRM